MRLSIFVFIFAQIQFLSAQQADAIQLRKVYIQASSTEELANELFDLTKTSDLKSNYLGFAYHAVAQTLQAKHSQNPIVKFNYFKEGINKLEQVIEKNPNEIELRFLRYCIQKKTPSFLNYSSSLEIDSVFITQRIIHSTKELQSYILPIFKNINDGRTSNTG